MLNQIQEKSGNEYYYHGNKYFIEGIVYVLIARVKIYVRRQVFDFIRRYMENANVPKFSNRLVLHIEYNWRHTGLGLSLFSSSVLLCKRKKNFFYFNSRHEWLPLHICIKFLYFYIFSNHIPQNRRPDSNLSEMSECNYA